MNLNNHNNENEFNHVNNINENENSLSNINSDIPQIKLPKDIRSTYTYVGMFRGILGFNTAVYSFTNPYNKKIYIGQTINILTRMLNHKNDLNRGAHPNKELQKDYNDLKKSIVDRDPINDFESRIYYNNVMIFEKNINLVIDEIRRLFDMEQTEIANAIERG